MASNKEDIHGTFQIEIGFNSADTKLRGIAKEIPVGQVNLHPGRTLEKVTKLLNDLNLRTDDAYDARIQVIKELEWLEENIPKREKNFTPNVSLEEKVLQDIKNEQRRIHIEQMILKSNLPKRMIQLIDAYGGYAEFKKEAVTILGEKNPLSMKLVILNSANTNSLTQFFKSNIGSKDKVRAVRDLIKAMESRVTYKPKQN